MIKFFFVYCKLCNVKEKSREIIIFFKLHKNLFLDKMWTMTYVYHTISELHYLVYITCGCCKFSFLLPYWRNFHLPMCHRAILGTSSQYIFSFAEKACLYRSIPFMPYLTVSAKLRRSKLFHICENYLENRLLSEQKMQYREIYFCTSSSHISLNVIIFLTLFIFC